MEAYEKYKTIVSKCESDIISCTLVFSEVGSEVVLGVDCKGMTFEISLEVVRVMTSKTVSGLISESV